VGEAPRIAIDNRYEAAYVVRRNGWVYFFGSSANCCAGPTTGYSVYVGRSRSPLEPPVDRDGISLNQSRVGGTVVITPNGNRWIGPGPQRHRHGPVRPGLVRLPRDRPRGPVPGRAVRDQRAPHAHRPPGLDRRLADRARRALGIRGAADGSRHHARRGRRLQRGHAPRRALAGQQLLESPSAPRARASSASGPSPARSPGSC
jgi:hypothetical protein